MQRSEHPLGMFPRQFGYPLSFRGQVFGTQSSLPCFPQWSLIARRPPSLRRVPASPVPRFLRYYEAATTSRRACPPAYVFASGFRPRSKLSCSLARSRRCSSPPPGRELCSPGAPGSGSFSYGRRRDLSGSLATPPAPLPCSETPAESIASGHIVATDAAPGSNTAKASAFA